MDMSTIEIISLVLTVAILIGTVHMTKVIAHLEDKVIELQADYEHDISLLTGHYDTRIAEIQFDLSAIRAQIKTQSRASIDSE